MSKENSNQNEEAMEGDEIFDQENPNQPNPKPQDGDDSEDASEQEVSDEILLAKINKETGKNFKSLDDWKQSVKNLEKAVAQKGREPKPAPKSDVLIKSLFFDKHPEAKEYWEEVEKEAAILRKDPFELYLSSSLLQKEAKAKFDSEAQRLEAEGKMELPSGKVDVAKPDDKNPFDRDYPTGFAINKK